MNGIEDLLHGSGVHIPIANHFSPGVASFYDGNFTVVDGHVKIKQSYLQDLIYSIVRENVTIGSGVYVLEEGEDLTSVPDDVNLVIDFYGETTAGVLYIRNRQGTFVPMESIKGDKGDRGVGISEIKLESSEGLVDTYVIIYDDGNTVSRFTVTNGKAGDCYVLSVNGKIGKVELTAADVGADPKGTASNLLQEHNINEEAHPYVLQLLAKLREDVEGLLDLDDESFDQFHEIGQVIRDNKDVIEQLTTSKVNVTDIVDNLDSSSNNKPLSAAQGKQLKSLIDNIDVGLSPEQESLINIIPDLKNWYDENHYVKMTGKLTSTKASGTFDMGKSFSVTFTWEFDKDLYSLMVGGNNITPPPRKGVKGELTKNIYLVNDKKVPVQGSVTFEIKGVHKGTYGDEVVKQSWTYNFRNKVYYGYLPKPNDTFTVDSAFIKNLAKSVQNGGGGGKGIYATDYKNAGFDFKNVDDDTRYVWYVYPARFEDTAGEPKFEAGGFEGGFTKAKTVPFTNDTDVFTEDYCVWHSTNPGVGRKTIVVE
jgi:hypothetical protein